MKRLFSASMCFVFVIAANLDVFGQQGGSWDRGSRGDRSNRGGFGGMEMGRGGPPGGFGGGGFGGPPGGFGGGGFGGPPGGFGGGGFGGPPGGFGGGRFGGPPGGDSSDRSSRFASMMDSNGNGRIDQDELDRMPSFVRDMMRSRGVELKAGMTLDDLRNTFRGGQTGQPNAPGGNQNPGNAPAPKVLTPYKMKPRKPITLTLPPAYSEDDTDFDGQIGLYEWMISRRAELDQFDVLDTDHDGYLIPDELMAAETMAAREASVASTEGKRLVIVTATPTKVQGNSNSSQNNSPQGGPGNQNSSRGGNPWESGDPNAMAAASFDRLDSNRDGFVDPDEWQQSRRVRGMFEGAGIRLDRMSRDQFTQTYLKLNTSAGRR